jgi:hypothetical protein
MLHTCAGTSYVSNYFKVDDRTGGNNITLEWIRRILLRPFRLLLKIKSVLRQTLFWFFFVSNDHSTPELTHING